MRDLAGSLEASRRQNAEGCVKTYEDLQRYRLVIQRVRPRCVLELGTFSGKSAVWFADTAGVPVITVDVHQQVSDAVREAAGDRVTWITGSSINPEVVSYLTGFALGCGAVDGQAQALVVLDSDHSGPHVLAELRAYSRLVPVGGYLVVEDGLLRWMGQVVQDAYDGNPLDALDVWLPEHPEFEPDTDLEDMHPTTQFPSGWLRRLR